MKLHKATKPTLPTLILRATSNGQKEDVIDHKAKLERLLQERERQRIEYLAADLAVKKFEQTIAKEKDLVETTSTRPLLNIDAALGFTSTLPHMNVSSESVPRSAVNLARNNFIRELTNIRDFLFQTPGDVQESENESEERRELKEKISQLKLSNDGVWKREYARPEVKAPWIIKLPYLFLCVLLDTLFDKRPINRFYFLETVARMPYFSYITMIHTYETLGWWRRSTEAKRVHFAEEYNEYHHLLIMESLGGDRQWDVRFLAQHASIVYYFVLIFVWILSPTLAYNFSEVRGVTIKSNTKSNFLYLIQSILLILIISFLLAFL